MEKLNGRQVLESIAQTKLEEDDDSYEMSVDTAYAKLSEIVNDARAAVQAPEDPVRAAAPDLREALEGVMKCIEAEWGADFLPFNLSEPAEARANAAVFAARVALAKARGESPSTPSVDPWAVLQEIALTTACSNSEPDRMGEALDNVVAMAQGALRKRTES